MALGKNEMIYDNDLLAKQHETFQQIIIITETDILKNWEKAKLIIPR